MSYGKTLGEYALCQVICSIRGVMLSTWGWIKRKKGAKL
jgi:hypothetical protein